MKPDLLHRIFDPPIFKDDYKGVVGRFLNAILTTIATIISLLLVHRLLNGGSLRLVPEQILLFVVSVSAALIVVNRKGHVTQAGVALVALTWLAMTYQAWQADGVYDVAVATYIIIILMTSVLINWRASAIVTVASLVTVWWMALGHFNSVPTPHTDTPLGLARDLTVIFLLAGFLIFYLVRTLEGAMAGAHREFEERIRAEQTLRDNDERFRRIFIISPVAISVTSLVEGILFEANEAYWNLTGFDARTSIGRTTLELEIWASGEERLKFVKKIVEKRSLRDPSYEFINVNGERHITSAFYELIDQGGEPAILSMFYDVTDQQKAQEALRESEAKYRNFIEQSMEGVWLLAFDEPISTSLPPEEQTTLIYKRGYIAECNDSLARMYGYATNVELIGTRLLDFAPGKTIDEGNYQATLKLVREGYRSGNRETREIRRDGAAVHFLNSAVGIVKDGMLVGLWGTQLDITAEKKSEDALRQSQARTNALLNAVPDMIFELRRDGTILHFIPSADNQPLLPPEQFIGRTVHEVLPSLADQTTFAVSRALESGQLHAFEYQLQAGEVTRTFEARITPAGPDLVLAMVRDVTLRKWAESERERLIDELEAKNAELERFTYTVSHDLKSPLITIKGFLGFIREDTAHGNLQRLETDIQRISDAADKMQRLLGDLLELSRIGRLTNKPELVETTALVREVLEYLHGRIHAANVTVQVEETLPAIFGDRQRIFEVFQNLIDNSAKFMGGQPNPRIEIGQMGESDGKPTFYVRDNGMGIAPEYKDRIFGLFNKLDAQSEGTGIGLTLVKRIVEFHGGRIWVDSSPGNGATFCFTLPSQPAPER